VAYIKEEGGRRMLVRRRDGRAEQFWMKKLIGVTKL
jgi:hypothetical protein